MELRMKRKYPISNKSRNTPKKRKTAIKQLEFKDLNEDCLIMIFQHLSIDDLVNMVEYNNYFKTAALIVFKQKFGNDNIDVSVEYNSMTKEALWCVQLLKYFGSEITQLNVKYYKDDSRQIDDAIDNAVIKYCHKSLVEIGFINSNSSTMHGIKKPFANVRTVSFEGGFVSETVYNLGKWFPKANTLKFKNMEEPKELFKIHIKNAPALEHFEVRFHTRYEYIYDMISQRIILNNPQLKSLYNEYVLDCYRHDSHFYDDYNDVGIGVDQTFVNLQMPNLESLHLVLPNERRLSGSDTGYDENGKFHFETLKHLHIEFKDSGVLKGLPISTDNLETLILIGLKHIKGGDCVNFIRDNQNVKSVKIAGSLMNGLHSDIDVLCELFPTLPNLSDLEISYDRHFHFYPVSFRIDALLERCKLLLKLVVHCDSKDDSQEMEQQFNNADNVTKSQWKISKDVKKGDYHHNTSYNLTFEKNSL